MFSSLTRKGRLRAANEELRRLLVSASQDFAGRVFDEYREACSGLSLNHLAAELETHGNRTMLLIEGLAFCCHLSSRFAFRGDDDRLRYAMEPGVSGAIFDLSNSLAALNDPNEPNPKQIIFDHVNYRDTQYGRSIRISSKDIDDPNTVVGLSVRYISEVVGKEEDETFDVIVQYCIVLILKEYDWRGAIDRIENNA